MDRLTAADVIAAVANDDAEIRPKASRVT